MNLTLIRKKYRPDGIFGELYDAMGDFICMTLEHAYESDLGGWTPKVALGVYTCVKHEPNRLPYETYMLQNVPPFQGKPVDGILIHILNYNFESEGCIGVGEEISGPGNVEMLTKSKETFQKFMALQKGVSQFRLVIISRPEEVQLSVGA